MTAIERPLTNAERKARWRRRRHEGARCALVEVDADGIDALEVAGYGPAAGIETSADLAAAVTELIAEWQAGVERG